MYELSIRIASAGDMSLERRTALQVIAELNEAYKGRLALAPTTAPRDAAAGYSPWPGASRANRWRRP